MGAQYRFLDRWFVPAPIDRVYEIVGDIAAYPSWWGDSFLEVEGDAGLPYPGRRADVLARGFLPYKVRWSATVRSCDPPHRIDVDLDGDFVGEGTWLLETVDGGTKAELDWRPAVEKPVVKQLSPVLKPLFSSNHRWAMRRGQEAIVRLVSG